MLKKDLSPDNPVHILTPYCPPESGEMAHLGYYRDDMAFHFEQGFFNLALFSFHYLYMTLVYIYLMKYHKFNRGAIKNALGGSRARKRVPLHITATVYSTLCREGEVIKLFETNDGDIESRHTTLVQSRNSVAHSSGAIIQRPQFLTHAKAAGTILERIKERALWRMNRRPPSQFASRISDINGTRGAAEREEKLSRFARDFYISPKDWEYYYEKGIIRRP
ncbi:MAG: hypothetical protein LBL46_01755 [Rickettsiales bacterium]|jgi:hypothetical protein|nr:hypothetical protein [Rickettsiales bacterium]